MKLLLRSSLVIIFILFICQTLYSAEACFSEKSTIKLETDLKQCDFDRQEFQKCEEDKALADEEIKQLKEKIELYKEAIKTNEQAIKQYKDLLQYQKDSYEKIIKENKPSIFREIFNSLGFIGIGIIVGLIL